MPDEQTFQLISTIITYAPAVAVLMWTVYRQQQLIQFLTEQVKEMSLRYTTIPPQQNVP